MPYDLFISYSRRDNERGQVTALKAQIETSYRAFAGRDLRVFFDTHEIAGMDDWRQKIQRSLRDSQVFLAVLSPNYLASPYCRWEWEDYVRYEAMRQCLGEGVAPVFFVTLPDAADPKTDQAIARWIDEIQRRQTFDLRPWHDAGEQALEQAHVRQTLEQLHVSVRERLNRAERSRSSPNNLIKHNPAFVGRVRELTELRNALTKNKLSVVGAREGQTPSQPSTINSQHSAVVQGLGGMGKTELALAYAHAFAWDYPGGRWQIPCEHLSDLRVALLHLANANSLNFEFSEDEMKNIALAFERVLRELNQRERCLLILDNVSDPNLLQPEYLDRLPRDGRVDLIATTRLAPRAIPGSAQEQTFIPVDELPEEDALALMRSHQREGHFVSQQEDDEARAIVRLLRGFTLAVETAGIYLGRDTAPDACRRFRERLSPDLLRESEIAATDSTVAVRHRVRSLEETLAFTLQTLTPEAMHLLNIASLLPAEQIALPWLKVVGMEQFPAFTAEPANQNSAFRQAEELLLGLRLFQGSGVTDNDGRLLVVRMHRLVQQLVAGREGLTGTQLLEKLVAHAETRCQFLHEGWLDWHNRWEIEPLRALAGELLAVNHSRASILANEVAFRLHEIARDAEAEPLYRRALAIDEKAFGPNHPQVASTLRDLTQLLQTTNRLAEAEPLMRRALAIHEQHPGSSHREVAKDLNALALLMQLTGRIFEAEKAFRQALTICERSRPETDRDLSSVLGNLALLLHQTRRLQEAEPLFRQALAIEEQNSGPDYFLVALRRHNLAALLKNTNRFNEAETLFRSAQRTWENYYGPEHPMVASAMNNLARLISGDGRVSEAESLLRRALAVDEQAFGIAHPAVARDLGNLGFLLKSTGRYSEAETSYRRALAIDQESFGADHDLVALRLNNLAQLLQDTNRMTDAEPIMRRVLEIRERNNGPNHPDVAAALNNLSGLLLASGRVTQAEPLIRRALDILEETLGPSHSLTENARSNWNICRTMLNH